MAVSFELRETHVSWVILAGDRAYKLKKPVRLPFVDQSTPERRRALCEEEVRVNQPLAAEIELGVRALVERDGMLTLAGSDAANALDWVVVMRRFDEERTMAALLRRGRLTVDDAQAAGVRIARFHHGAAPVDVDLPDVERALWTTNLDELEDVGEALAGADRIAAWRRFVRAFVADHRALLAERAVVDGHGDLRAEHVLVTDDGVVIVDRLEFSAALRHVDVADDLAFLLMDLEDLGARWAADAVVAGYRDAGGDAGPPALLAFYAAYRAQVRAKIAALRGEKERAGQLAALADRFVWRAREPGIVLVTGPPASGKTTVASALAATSGFPLLSSDVVRAEVARGPDRYTPGRRGDVYATLGRRAAAQLATEAGVVVDATFGAPELQRRFADGLGPDAPQAWVVACETPLADRLERAARRGPGQPSEAGAAVAARLAAAHTAMPAPPGRRLTLDGRRPPAVNVLRVAAWLDERRATAAVTH